MATGGGRIERGVTPASAEEWTVGSRVVGAVADAENIRLDLKSQISGHRRRRIERGYDSGRSRA